MGWIDAARVERVSFQVQNDMHEVIMLVKVDDLVILDLELSRVKRLIEELKRLFKLTVLGELKYYFGVCFKRIGNIILLLQLAYCSCILGQFGIEMARAGLTPIVENVKEFILKLVSSEAEHKVAKEFSYRSPIGSLLNLSTHTRLHITILVGILSEFLESPTTAHWAAAKRVLRYLKGIKETRIKIGAVTSGLKMQNDNF